MSIQDFNTALSENNSEQMQALGELREPRLLKALEASVEPGGWLEWA